MTGLGLGSASMTSRSRYDAVVIGAGPGVLRDSMMQFPTFSEAIVTAAERLELR